MNLPLFFATSLFVIVWSSPPYLLCLSLSFDESSSPNRIIRRVRQQMMPGIWKLTTDSLPYERDIKSQLGEAFSLAASGDVGDKKKDANNEVILLKLNEDGTFKQCDEGYQEGRWVTGRWKLQFETKCKEGSSDWNSQNVLLMLAMNRQYFGPPYDVLLEANKIICNSTANASSSEHIADGSARMKLRDQEEVLLQESLRNWRGIVQKGKFIRPSPRQHPFDFEPCSSNQNGQDGNDIDDDSDDNINGCTSTNILMDPEPLGVFSLEQALTTSLIHRRVSRRGKNSITGDSVGTMVTNNESEETDLPEEDNDGTFFSPDSSSDDGILQ
mmetsp:Transcript_118170/g.241551  ORF Transcript_118170/g.241551 Transcript_118170/m.241551 type:complete len:328 (+) Transcript_118170:85-1068(+)